MIKWCSGKQNRQKMVIIVVPIRSKSFSFYWIIGLISHWKPILLVVKNRKNLPFFWITLYIGTCWPLKQPQNPFPHKFLNCHIFVRYCINLFPLSTPQQFSLEGMVFALNLRMSRGIGLKKIRIIKIITWRFFVHSCLRRDQHCYPPQCLLLLPNQKTDTAQLLCPSLCGFCDHGTIFAWNFDKNVRKITS